MVRFFMLISMFLVSMQMLLQVLNTTAACCTTAKRYSTFIVNQTWVEKVNVCTQEAKSDVSFTQVGDAVILKVRNLGVEKASARKISESGKYCHSPSNARDIGESSTMAIMTCVVQEGIVCNNTKSFLKKINSSWNVCRNPAVVPTDAFSSAVVLDENILLQIDDMSTDISVFSARCNGLAYARLIPAGPTVAHTS